MLQPGSKGWINKYFHLVEKGVFQLEINRPKDISVEHFLHITFGHSGIVFGYPSDLLFATNLDKKFDINFGAPGQKASELCLVKIKFLFLHTNAASNSDLGRWTCTGAKFFRSSFLKIKI